jgi:N-acetylneuraminate lyase
MEKLTGLVAAPFTPMDPSGEVMYDRIPDYYDFLVRNRCSGAFINGSTGEGVSLTIDERKHIAEAWTACKKSDPGLRVINLVGGTSWRECATMARHSAQVGIDAVAVLAPYYFKPAGAAELAHFVTLVGREVPDTPLYFYHIPVLSGVNIPMISLIQHLAPMLPNFAGIKYTHEDFMDYQSCLNFDNGRFDLLWGRDENMLAALALGAQGAVGSTYNYAAPLYHQLIEAFDAGNLPLARQLQQRSIDMIRLLGKYGGIATGKAYMRYIGFDCGAFRSPIRNPTHEEYERFVHDVKHLDMETDFSK